MNTQGLINFNLMSLLINQKTIKLQCLQTGSAIISINQDFFCHSQDEDNGCEFRKH